MKYIRYLFTAIIILFAFNSNAFSQETIKGKVRVYEKNERVEVKGAIVKWINTNKGTETDAEGNFELSKEGITDERLIVSMTGFLIDTISAMDKKFVFITLQPYKTDEIIVEGQEKSNTVLNKIGLTEKMTSAEFEKAACCDLSGCFGTNSSVEVKVTDVINKTKDMKLLGVTGAYTQILVDNLPIMSGLPKKYGISGIPGTLINSIMISKGSNSVLQGYESISGIINVLLKDKESSEKLFVNGFVNEVLEKQFNVNYGEEFGKWNTLISGHTVQKSNRVDHNGDGFMDNPLTTRYMLYNKWKYDANATDGFDLALKYLNEKRTGGQNAFDRITDIGGNTIYGQTADLEDIGMYGRFTFQTGNESSLKAVISAGKYDESSYYGFTNYDGKQTDFYTSAYLETPMSASSILRFGASYRYQKINEEIKFLNPTRKTYDGNYEKKESVPGVFAESTTKLFDNKLELLTGIRVDHDNKFGLFATPRALMKFDISPFTIIRASAGTGFRTINLFSEYASILATSRNIIITEELEPEKAINLGVNLVQYFDAGSFSGSFILDFYRTDFMNQIIADYDSGPSEVIFSNLNGDSFSNILQAETSVSFLEKFDAKLAYKFSDVRYTHNGIEREYPFVSKHNVLSSLTFSPDDQWSGTVTAEWNGKQRLPSTTSNPVEYRRPTESEPFTMVGLQITRRWDLFEFYAGVENILDFRQEDPIIGNDDPFGPYFDTSFIWGPTMGREVYAGFRVKVK